MHRSLTLALSLAATVGVAAAAQAADTTALVVYSSTDASLYAPGDGASTQVGYATVREARTLQLAVGMQQISIGGLPTALDTDGLALSFGHGEARVVSQRLQLGQGSGGMLGALVGQPVQVLGSGGDVLASGTLEAAGNTLLVRGGSGQIWVRDYAAVRSNADIQPGAWLDLQLDAKRAGAATSQLSYVSRGLGWQASYVGHLRRGSTCALQLDSRASVANRSGRDWHTVDLTLIAGQPNIERSQGPRPVMYKAMSARSDALPQQSALADYRSFHLPSPVALPNDSVSLLPLYANHTLTCQRTALYENGSGYRPQRPNIDPDFNPGGSDTIISTLGFTAFDSLPAGTLRVLTDDAQGVPQFIGEGRVEDTPKGQHVQITLGQAFDLKGSRKRTSFKVHKSQDTLDESFRVTLSNAGDSERTVTVREHPDRWREWTLTSSSTRASRRTPDTLEFEIPVPAGGHAQLDYAVHYHWSGEQ